MRKFLYIFISILFCVCNVHAQKSFISGIYCKILGDQDASSQYIQEVQEAFKFFKVKDRLSIPIKKMNAVGPSFARVDLSSFTAFGIWLDEKYLDTLSETERVFNIYHEVSHYVQHHHQKLFAGCGIAALLVALGLVKLGQSLNTTLPYKVGAVSVVGFLAAIASYRYLLPYFVKRQEKQADLMAAETLILLNKSSVVSKYIEILKRDKGSDNGCWWPTKLEKLEYLAF